MGPTRKIGAEGGQSQRSCDLRGWGVFLWLLSFAQAKKVTPTAGATTPSGKEKSILKIALTLTLIPIEAAEWSGDFAWSTGQGWPVEARWRGDAPWGRPAKLARSEGNRSEAAICAAGVCFFGYFLLHKQRK